MEVKLHDIGEGMTEANVNHFLVKAGDTVKADQPLVEVQTDKMTAEIPAPFSGRIKELKVGEGETIPVGTTVLLMEKEDGMPEAVTQPKKPQGIRARRVLASPYTRKIARENGVDLDEVTGSGAGGRILDEDVYTFLQKDTGSQPEEPIRAEEALEVQEVQPDAAAKDTSTIPFRGRRKQIASKMTHSLRTIAHCTHFEEIDMTNLLEWKETMKSRGQSISMGAYFIKVISICLKEFPLFNAELDEKNECVHLKREHHIGLATDTEEGLIVPVIRNVEAKSMKIIHQEMKELTRKAQENRLTVKEMTGGTFTVSNVGPLNGSIGATPIINEPETGLLAFHKTKKRPMVNENDEIVIRSMMNVSMSFDHRVADGGTAVRFTNRLRDLIEEPQTLLLELI
ncbi:dihydrolipoyllysine acetyltransferase [[Bacillus] enclensis]|uniref:Dihydrolipoamide acetyltransferase component of pyruvate dehydrogenase complex n=1 Tax=[Bacillus] enclensis TaxID=1402860 RepID=A0A0V8HGD4_9BACI|nr:dihydrolipoamide acetyltransferase family protein [[Bacillus] enclensis]KSU61557.1 dihydrolipoyllysine acetyltransferase [[Bacillus] enclensis]SCC18916.1 pyruvate dehydrogenase E2 component (dihydrolipoamide acetyltransferase) [[Bacillus] enclensis]